MLAFGPDVLTVLWIASLLLSAGMILSQKKPKAASADDFLGSTATQGAYIPLVIGRERVPPVFAYVEDMTSLADFSDGEAPLGGKGMGGVPSPPTYQEKGLHLLCVGPASSLTAIYQNGELIWKGPITPSTHPSGSSVTIPGPSGTEGTFKVYWGFRDDPVIVLANVTSRFPLAMKILWEPKNLGQSRQWPRLEYEVTCPCYSEIVNTASQVALQGNDLKPTFQEWIDDTQSVGYTPNGRSPGNRAVMDVVGFNAVLREVLIMDKNLLFAQNAALPQLFPSVGIIKLITPNNLYVDPSTPATHLDNLASILPTNNVWKYFWVVRSDVFPNPVVLSTGVIRLVLGPEVIAGSVNNLDATVPGPTPAGTWHGFATPVSVVDSDGVNAIHMIDQLLFAKFPYGAARDRSRFDSRSIEAAAEVLAAEKIRASIMIQDGEGLESALAPVLQDIGLMIPWDVEVGKYVFRVIRYNDTGIDLPRDIILNQPEMLAIQGDRPVDVVAFTYKDRQRNYREVPIKVVDSGQITEYESQRAQKVPIEVTKDRDSISRIAPRRQQEALTNLANLDFETNHATVIAMPGTRFRAEAVEGEGIQFLITEVQRQIDSSKVVLSTVIDSYNAPLLGGTDESPRFEDLTPAPGSTAIVDTLDDFQAIEMPSGRSIQVLFLASRKSTQTASAAAWGSRDGTTFNALGDALLAVRGVLAQDLSAGSATVLEGPVDFTPSFLSDAASIEDLTLSEDAWRAGRQLMLIGEEVIYLKNGYPNDLFGLLRGRQGTVPASYAAGTPFFIILAYRVVPTSSQLYVVGRNLHYKVQAITSKKGEDVSLITEKTLTLTGRAFTPKKPPAVRLANFRTTYAVGAAEVKVLWSYFSDEFVGTGIGEQPLGVPIGNSPPQGHFLVTVYNNLGTELASSTVTVNEVVLTLATRNALGLDALPGWSIDVVHIMGSFSSPPASINLTPA